MAGLFALERAFIIAAQIPCIIIEHQGHRTSGADSRSSSSQQQPSDRPSLKDIQCSKQMPLIARAASRMGQAQGMRGGLHLKLYARYSGVEHYLRAIQIHTNTQKWALRFGHFV